MATAPGVDDHDDEGLKEAGEYVSSLPRHYQGRCAYEEMSPCCVRR